MPRRKHGEIRCVNAAVTSDCERTSPAASRQAGSAMLACPHDGSRWPSSRLWTRAVSLAVLRHPAGTHSPRDPRTTGDPELEPFQRSARPHAVLERGHAQGLLQKPRGAQRELLRHERPAPRNESAGQSREGQGAARPRCQPDRKSGPARLPGSRGGRTDARARVRGPRRRQRLLLVQRRAGIPDPLRSARRVRGAGGGREVLAGLRGAGGHTRHRRCRPATRSRNG